MLAEDFSIPATDGFLLAATLLRPAQDNGRAVIIAPGTGIPRRFYRDYAQHLAHAGFTVLTFDYRGVGDSRPTTLKGFRATMRGWGETDLTGAITWARSNLAPARLLVVGHSAGTWLTAISHGRDSVDAVLSIASMSGYWGNMASPGKYWLAFVWYALAPVVTRIYGYLPGKFGTKEDLPKGVALEWARWCRDPDYFFNDYRFNAAERLGALAVPLRAYQFSDDPWGTRKATHAVLKGYRNAELEYREIAPQDIGAKSIGHLGFFRRNAGEALWPETAQWLRNVNA